ncbi:MAG: hypothetical protein K6347_07025 [Campylobacterales bacterium]
METFSDYIHEAVAEARRGVENGDGGPFGAVVVKDGKIIGRGHNRVLATNNPNSPRGNRCHPRCSGSSGEV